MVRAPAESRVARFQRQAAAEGELEQVERTSQLRAVDLALPEIRHALRAGHLMANHGRRALVLRPRQLAIPYRDAVDHAAREPVEPALLPRIGGGNLELRLSLELA